MTSRQYKRMCRIKVTRCAKLITYICLMVFFLIADVTNLSGYTTAAVGTTIWFYMPDIATYILEHTHKLKHDFISYR